MWGNFHWQINDSRTERWDTREREEIPQTSSRANTKNLDIASSGRVLKMKENNKLFSYYFPVEEVIQAHMKILSFFFANKEKRAKSFCASLEETQSFSLQSSSHNIVGARKGKDQNITLDKGKIIGENYYVK